MLNIRDFDMTPERGFLTPHDMGAVTLPDAFQPIVKAGRELSGYLTTGRVQHFLRQVPEIDMAAHIDKLTDAQLRMLMVHYSFVVQAYVWGEEAAAKVLPRNLAVPYCILADKIGQFPLLPYTSYTLDNWVKIDPKGGITLDNIRTIQNFYGGVDENWFILVHVEIEATAGSVLALIPTMLEQVKTKDIAGLKKNLKSCVDSWEKINAIFKRMTEKCDPYMYYNRVRPYIHGWKGNPALPEGLIYEGVAKYNGQPQSFRGQTGSQSSIVPVMDALLQIAHENDPLREYLDELHAYRPPKHRLFIEAVQKESTLRSFIVQSADVELVRLYNQIVDNIQRFRSQHLEFAASYINKQAEKATGNPVEIGTGGTPFMKYLKKHRNESVDHFLPEPGAKQATQ